MNQTEPERIHSSGPLLFFSWLVALVDAALIVDIAGRIVAANQSALDMFEFSSDQLLGRNLGALYPEEFAHRDLDSDYIALMKAGEITRLEVILQKRSGSQFPAKISIAAFELEGAETFYLVQIENLSSQKIVEASRILKQKAAEAESRRKMDFLSVMSHEIRTPLHGISGALSLLEHFIAPDGRRVFNLVQSSLQSLFRILDDVLLNASLELDQLTLQCAPFSIYQIGDELLSLYRHVAEVSHNDLLLRVAANVPRQLAGDGGRIRQILANYLMNALKFTQQELVWIEVDYDAQKGLQVSVSDNGQGIGVEARKKLFDMFGQGDAVTRTAYAGTGLGLAICKRLAQRMGGQVGFRSDPGKGSSFWFSVPLEASTCSPPKPVLEGRSVALVADRHSEIWQAQLADWGAHTVVLRNGSLQAEMDSPVDLVFVVLRDGAARSDILARSAPMGAPILIVGDVPVINLPGNRVRVVANPFDLREIWDSLALLLGTSPAFTDDHAGMAASQPPSEGVGRKILLAEDSELNAEIFGTLLRAQGYRVEIAADGMQAIEAFKRFSPELILMDIQMPVCDGYGAARAIRQYEAERGMPPVRIFALTADVATAQARDSSGILFDQVLCKPIPIADLVRAIEKGVASSADTARSQPADPCQDPAGAQLDTRFLQRQFGKLRSGVVLAMTGIFQDEASQCLALCRQAIQNDGLLAIQQQAHALKSSAAGLGLTRLAELAKALEQQAKAADTQAVQRTLDQAQAVFEPDLASLRAYLNTQFSAGASC